MNMRKVVFPAFLALALGAGAAPWFDAGISGYTEWPSDGSDFPVAGAGTWSGTANAALVRTDGKARLQVMTSNLSNALAFGPDADKDIAENLVFKLTVSFCLFLDLPPVEPSVKTALTALDKGNGQFAYYGLVADEAGGTNRWAELSGATPRDGLEVEIEVYMRPTDDGSAVRYVVDGTPLARNAIVVALSIRPTVGRNVTTTRDPESTVYVPFDCTTSVSPTFTETSSAPAIAGIVRTVGVTSPSASAESAASAAKNAIAQSFVVRFMFPFLDATNRKSGFSFRRRPFGAVPARGGGG